MPADISAGDVFVVTEEHPEYVWFVGAVAVVTTGPFRYNRYELDFGVWENEGHTPNNGLGHTYPCSFIIANCKKVHGNTQKSRNKRIAKKFRLEYPDNDASLLYREDPVVKWYWDSPTDSRGPRTYRLRERYARYNRMLMTRYRNPHSQQGEMSGYFDNSTISTQVLDHNILFLGSPLLCGFGELNARRAAVAALVQFPEYSRLSDHSGRLEVLQGMVLGAMDGISRIYQRETFAIFNGKEFPIRVVSEDDNVENDESDSHSETESEGDNSDGLAETESDDSESDDPDNPDAPDPLPRMYWQNVSTAVSGNSAIPNRGFFPLKKVDSKHLMRAERALSRNEGQAVPRESEEWTHLPFVLTDEQPYQPNIVCTLSDRLRDAVDAEDADDISTVWYPAETYRALVENTLDDNDDYPNPRMSKWSDMPSERDEITRWVADIHNRTPGPWALIGIRAHRKCYARSFLKSGDWPHDNDNTNKTQWICKAACDLGLNQALVAIADEEEERRDWWNSTFVGPDVVWQPRRIVRNRASLAGDQSSEALVLPPRRGKYAVHGAEEWSKLYGTSRERWFEQGAGYLSIADVFAENLRAILCCAVKNEGITDFRDVAPEYSVYWPFGIFTLEQRMDSASRKLGRAYHTLIDLVAYGEKGDQARVILVEYKTRMETSSSVSKRLALTGDRDAILQARLNAWMFYLSTGVEPDDVWVVSATRRVRASDYQTEWDQTCSASRAEELKQAIALEEAASTDEAAKPLRLVGSVATFKRMSSDSEEEDGSLLGTERMVRLISQFALQPFPTPTVNGDQVPGVTRYVDSQFCVPNVHLLIEALGLPAPTELNPHWEHDVFAQVLASCDFGRAVAKVTGREFPLRGAHQAGAAELEDKIVLRLPRWCAAPLDDSMATLLPSKQANSNQNQQPFLKINNALNPTRSRHDAEKYKELFAAPIGNHARIDAEYLAGTHVEYTTGYINDSEGRYETRNCMFVPVLFSSLPGHTPLIFVNIAHKTASRRRANNDAPEDEAFTEIVVEELILENNQINQLSASTAVVPTHGTGVFRSGCQVMFNRRNYCYTQDSEPQTPMYILDECNHLRDKLRRAVEARLEWLCQQVSGIPRIRDINRSKFWDITVNKIFRRNTTSRGPRIREFRPQNDEPYAPAPAEDGRATRGRQADHRRSALRRCLHRLVNTRLMRGAMAMVGMHDAEYEMIDDPTANWARRRFAQWKRAENHRIRELMPFAVDEDLAHPQTWWESTSSGRTAPDGHPYSRSACFPHNSQRGLWSREALMSMTIATVLGGGESTVPHVCAEHIFADVNAAVTEALQELDANGGQ